MDSSSLSTNPAEWLLYNHNRACTYGVKGPRRLTLMMVFSFAGARDRVIAVAKDWDPRHPHNIIPPSHQHQLTNTSPGFPRQAQATYKLVQQPAQLQQLTRHQATRPTKNSSQQRQHCLFLGLLLCCFVSGSFLFFFVFAPSSPLLSADNVDQKWVNCTS